MSYLESFIAGESKSLFFWGNDLIQPLFSNITSSNGNSLLAMICLILYRNIDTKSNILIKWFLVDENGGYDILNNNFTQSSPLSTKSFEGLLTPSKLLEIRLKVKDDPNALFNAHYGIFRSTCCYNYYRKIRSI